LNFSISKNNIICSKAAKLLQHFGPTLILTKVAKEKSKEKSFHIQSSIQSFVHPSGHSFIHTSNSEKLRSLLALR
jgi:hypothetical protein